MWHISQLSHACGTCTNIFLTAINTLYQHPNPCPPALLNIFGSATPIVIDKSPFQAYPVSEHALIDPS